MRLFYVLCVVLCALGALTPATHESEVTPSVATRLVSMEGPARPVTLTFKVRKPQRRATARATSSPKPRVAKAAAVPKATPKATPKPAPKPAAKPTPKPTSKPTPKPAPKASAPSSSYSRDEVKAAIRQAWHGDDDKAIRVADCESALNPRASSPNQINLGLWQMRKETWRTYGGPGNDPRDASPGVQTQVAWRLFQDRGWAPWGGCA